MRDVRAERSFVVESARGRRCYGSVRLLVDDESSTSPEELHFHIAARRQRDDNSEAGEMDRSG